MANDEQRGASLLAHAERLAATEPQLAHEIRKYVDLVVARDEGPSDLVKAENNAIRSENETLRQRVTQLEADIAEHQAVRGAAVRAIRLSTDLRAQNEDLVKRNREFIAKHNAVVDQLAAMEGRARSAEDALAKANEPTKAPAPVR